MKCSVGIVDQVLTIALGKLGGFIADRPSYFLIVPFFVALLAATGFQQVTYEDDPEFLFTPENGRAKTERAVVIDRFPFNASDFFTSQRTTHKGRLGRVVLFSRDNETIFRRPQFQDVLEMDAIIQNITIQHLESTYRFEDICARVKSKCMPNRILDLYDVIDKFESGEETLSWPIFFNAENNGMYVLPGAIASPELDESRSTVLSTPAIGLFYYMVADTPYEDERGFLWEQAFLKKMAEIFDDFEHIKVFYFASRSVEEELEKNTQSVKPYFASTIIVMVAFSGITCMMMDWVKSKPYLGLLGVVSSMLGTAAAFGFLMYIGVPYIGINIAAPFLMLGIGMDDTFVMLSAWRRTNPSSPTRERMAHAYSDAAVSITITSMTDMLSFFVGAFTTFPCVRIFCLYTGTSVLTVYFFHLTFFGACMAYLGFAEENNRHGILCIQVTPKSQAANRSRLYRIFCTGGISRDDPNNLEDNKDHCVMKFFGNQWSRLLNIPAIKVLVIMVFLAYLAMALFGLQKLQEGLDRRRLSRDDSYSVKFYDVEEEYFREFPYKIQIIVDGEIDYSNKKVQDDMDGLLRKLEADKMIGETFYSDSWLRQWLSFVKINAEYLDIDVSNNQAFIDSLRNYFLVGDENENALDIKFDANYTKIVSSRFFVQVVNVTDLNDDRRIMEFARQVADTSTYNVTVFHPYFIFFDQLVDTKPYTIQSIGVAGAIMMVVTLIFIPNPLCALWVGFSIVSILIGVMGYMSLWGVNLDTISMINLIMCIGFSVDFSAHISYAFMSSKVETPAERMSDALHHLGLPILQGSVSTILGIFALVYAPSYIFVTFFKIVFLVMFFGAVHGLLLLPVLLSIFGPGTCGGKKNKITPASNDQNVIPVYANTSSSFLMNRVAYFTAGGMDSGRATNGATPFMAVSSAQQVAPSNSKRTFLMDATLLMKNGTFVNGDSKQGKTKQLGGKPGKRAYDSSDKDLGLGTSGEDSSESSFGPNGQNSATNSPRTAHVSNGQNLRAQPDRQQQQHQQQLQQYRSYSMREDGRRRRADDVLPPVSSTLALVSWTRGPRGPPPTRQSSARMRSYHENHGFIFGEPRR